MQVNLYWLPISYHIALALYFGGNLAKHVFRESYRIEIFENIIVGDRTIERVVVHLSFSRGDKDQAKNKEL